MTSTIPLLHVDAITVGWPCLAVVNHPAGYPEVISVAAVNEFWEHAEFSDWNSDVEW